MNIITERFTLSTWSIIEDVGDEVGWQLWSVRRGADRIGFVALPWDLTTDEILTHPLVIGIAG